LLKARLLLAVMLLLNSLALPAQPAAKEYEVKAAFLFNFTRFVEWPPAAFSSAANPFVIGVLGENPFGTYMESIVEGEKVNGHPVTVAYYKTAAEIKTCHILFVSQGESKKLGLLINDLNSRSILTVSDAGGFLKSGGMIRLFSRDSKIKMEVNVGASKAGNLVISSRLLKLAEIYKTGKNS